MWAAHETASGQATPLATVTPTAEPSPLATSAPLVVSCGGCPRALVDRGAIDLGLAFPAEACAGRVQDVDVALQIAHPYRGDVTVLLAGPEVPFETMFGAIGGDGDDFGTQTTALTLDDDAARSLEQGDCNVPRLACAGRFRTSRRTLDRQFAGTRPGGTWVLRVADGDQAATGTILDWKLLVRCPAVPATPPTPSSTLEPTASATAIAPSTPTMVVTMTPLPTPPPTALPTLTATASAVVTPQFGRGRSILPYLSKGDVLVIPTLPPTPAPTPACLDAEIEPNDFYVQVSAQLPMCPDVSLAGTLPASDLEDLFRIEVTQASTMVAELDLSELPAGSNADLFLYRRGDSASLASSRRPGTLPEELRVHVAAGTYYLRVLPTAQSTRSERPYRLRWHVAP